MNCIKLLLLIILIQINPRQLRPRNTNIFIPEEYRYPEDSLMMGRTFVMQKEGESFQNYSDRQLKITPLGRVLTEKRYRDKQLDSTIFLNDRMLETYNNIYGGGELLKGEILQDTLIRDGSRLGQYLQKVIYHAPQFDILVSSHQQYWKDTSIVWNQHLIDCLVMRSEANVRFQLPGDSTALQDLPSFHTTYYGKGIGLLRFTTSFKDKYVVFNLKEVRSMSTGK